MGQLHMLYESYIDVSHPLTVAIDQSPLRVGHHTMREQPSAL